MRAVKTILKIIVSAALIIFIVRSYQLHINNNFHEVIKGELYRSAQISQDDMAYYQKKYGIKTIINLRGARPGRDWYPAEKRGATALGIAHYDWAVSSTLETPMSHMDHIMWLMKKAEKPILIHCQAGADRTALGVAIYLYGIKNLPAKEAKSEAFSIKYGHFPYFWTGTHGVAESFDKFAAGEKSARGRK